MSYAQLIGDWQALAVLFVAGVVPNQIWRMLGLWFGVQFLSLDEGGVAWWAHIGGFAAGVVVGIPLRLSR